MAYQACGPLACNIYALICGITGDAALVDPSTCDSEEWERLNYHLEGKTVKHILLTHGHADHVVGVADAMRTWPDAKLYMHPLEEENYHLAQEQGKFFGLQVPRNLPLPTNELGDGDIINIGETIRLKTIHTPGHAPGHVAFVDDRPSPESKGAVIIGGDLLFRGSVGRTDFFNSSLEDMFASLRRLNELFHDESIVLSGHTTPTKLGTEKLTNPFVATALKRPQEWFNEAKERLGWF